ncbi:hypothetical protein DPMN_071349 [Dreissena polymorpha]|uniref:Uncharacterized protein n=1 Tax=Dreissena polymorpha TaxID=45954 RepID=A0A9D4BW79_DREPO|nr:hypothetical protein DPMN_071349 [Dreissena polymorpha]
MQIETIKPFHSPPSPIHGGSIFSAKLFHLANTHFLQTRPDGYILRISFKLDPTATHYAFPSNSTRRLHTTHFLQTRPDGYTLRISFKLDPTATHKDSNFIST